MLTEREKAIKDRLLLEIEGAPHAEKRRVGERLDLADLTEGARIARRQQRWRLLMGMTCFAYIAAVTVAMGLKVGRWTPPVLVLIGVVWMVAYFRQYEWFRRRLLAYQILELLGDPVNEGDGVPRESAGEAS